MKGDAWKRNGSDVVACLDNFILDDWIEMPSKPLKERRPKEEMSFRVRIIEVQYPVLS